jgi:hypothetical protein
MATTRDPLGMVERLIDELQAYSDASPGGVAGWFTQGKVVVPDEEFFRILHDIRENLPSELSEARQMLEKRDLIIRNAQEEHRRIMESAERRLEEMVSREQVVVAAEAEAQRIIGESKRRAEQIGRDALKYSDEQLAGLEAQFNQALQTVKKGRDFIAAELGARPEAESSESAAG